MIDLPWPVNFCAWVVSATVLAHTVVHSAGDAPKGTNVEYWKRVVRAWRHRRRYKGMA